MAVKRLPRVLCVVLALTLLAASGRLAAEAPISTDEWMEECVVAQRLGIRLDVNSSPFADSRMGSYLGLGVGTTLHLFGGDLVIHAFPDDMSSYWSSASLRQRGTDTSLVRYDSDRLRTICYLITTYIEEDEYLVWRKAVYAVIGAENRWSIELEWDVDPILANLAGFYVPVGFRVYRRFVPENVIGTICHETFDDLVLIEDFRVSPGQSKIVFADEGTYGHRDEGRPGIASAGRVDVDDPLGSFSIGRNLGVGVSAPGSGPGNARFAGNVGIGTAPVAGLSLKIGDLGFGANIGLKGTTATGRLWELNSTNSGCFEILDDGQLRFDVSSITGDVRFNLGDPSLPLSANSQGTFEVWENALSLPVSRLAVGENTSITIGSDGIPAGQNQSAIGPSLGRFVVNDDTLPQPRLWVDDEVVFSLGHDTVLPPTGGAAALAILRDYGSFLVVDELEGIERLNINDQLGNSSLVIGTQGLAPGAVPAGFEGDEEEPIPAVASALGTFAIHDVNFGVFTDRLRIEASGTYFHLGNPAIANPDPAGGPILWSSGEFVITDEMTLDPRFKINTDGKVGIGLDPTGGPAGSLEVAHALGIGTTVPARANAGDVFFGGNLEAAKNVDILGNVTVAADLEVLGVKFFVQEHPTDPTKEIAYAALEGPEAGTYVRGTACLVDGDAVIELPESFALVTAEDGLTAQVTLLEPCNGLYVAEKSTDRIVVRELMEGTSSARFDYLVQGVRAGYEDYDPIREATSEGGE